MCKLMEEAMERNDEMTERRVADRRVVAVAGGVDRNAVRLDKMLDWYLNEGKRSSIDPYGHISQTTKGHIIHWLDGGSNVDPQVRDRVASNAAPQQVDAVQAVPEGWLIEWTGPDGTKYSELSRHNSVADYRYIDENATGTALVRAALASPSPAVPTATFDRAEFIRQVVASVAEIPDRDSPDEQPEMMLVTGSELKNIMENYFEMADEDADVATPVAGQAAQGAVPEGLALVPTAPTPKMLEAAAKADDEGFAAGRSHGASGREIYDAMLAAAPGAQPTDTTAGE